MRKPLLGNLNTSISRLYRALNCEKHLKRYMRALSYIASRHFDLPAIAASIRPATRECEAQPECKSRITHEFGLDPHGAFHFWRNELSSFEEAYAVLKKSNDPDECLFSKEFAETYTKQREVNISYACDGLYGNDLSRLPALLVQRDAAFNCFPLVLSILEKGFATYPSCLDEHNRPPIASSICACTINGGPHIAYLFKRSESEINSIIFGGYYGMILATCTIKSGSARIRWFGSEIDGPRSLQSQIDAVEKLAQQILDQHISIVRQISRHRLSSLPPLCLVGHFNSIGHYIWNELPLLSIVDQFPKPLHIAVGEYDFANLLESVNSASKCYLGRTEINGIAHSLADDHVYYSLRPLVILKDIFSLGKQETKAVIHEHLDRLADNNSFARTTINRLTVAIGLRITGARQFLSTVELIKLIDSVFEEISLQPSYYLDGYTLMPPHPSFNLSTSSLEAIAVEGLIGKIPARILDRVIPYTNPTMADKRIVLEACLCGFYPIGSSAIFQGWLTSIPAFYFDDGRYYKEFVQQDYLCNYLKNSCYFIEPNLFCADPAKDGYCIGDSFALRNYLKQKICFLLEEHFEK
jgi:hypothetical protein